MIEVQHAEFGTTGYGDDVCCLERQDCAMNVTDVSSKYYQEILDSCDGRHACGNLSVERRPLRDCSYAMSTYVEIFYQCVAGLLNRW